MQTHPKTDLPRSYETVHSILDAAAYWTLGFVDPQGQPQIVPILGTLDVNDETGEIYAYLHGKAFLVSSN